MAGGLSGPSERLEEITVKNLLSQFEQPCTLLEKRVVDDGESGQHVEWQDGVKFPVYMYRDSSMEARIGEKQGVTSVYDAMVKKDFPLKYDDYYRNDDTGKVFRVTSNPEEKTAPNTSSFKLKAFTAERVELPR